MKRIKVLMLVFAILLGALSGCAVNVESGATSQGNEIETEATSTQAEITRTEAETSEALETTTTVEITATDTTFAETKGQIEDDGMEESVPGFAGMDDPDLLQYLQDDIVTRLEYTFDNDDYIIEDIAAAYVSKEYLEELEYNSQANIFFGYTLEELDDQFEGSRYVFSLGDNSQTSVEEFEAYDDYQKKVLTNLAIGTGVIMVAVTITVVSGGVAGGVVIPSTVSTIFTAAAETGAVMAVSGGLMSGVSAGIVEGIKTKDFDKAIKAAALEGSKGFKWGAISGVITGGAGKALELYKGSRAIPTPRQSEETVLKLTKGKGQVSYLDGKEVPYATPGASRPDVVRFHKGKLQAIEVKNYGLESSSNRANLISKIKSQVSDRVKNLPANSEQVIVLDVRGRGFSPQLIAETKNSIIDACSDVTNLVVEILG